MAEKADISQAALSQHENGYLDLTNEQQERLQRTLSQLINKRAVASERAAAALKLNHTFPVGEEVVSASLPPPEIVPPRMRLNQLMKMKRLMEEIRNLEATIALLTKKLSVSEALTAKEHEIAFLRLSRSNELAEKVDHFSDRLLQNPGPDEVRRIATAMKAALEE